MYEEHIRAAARSMAENMQRSPVPMYGKGLRLPDKGAVIGLLKEIRRLVFPAYYGDPELMTLLAEDYTALLLERIEGQLTRQIALALPEEQEQRAPMLAREVVEALPGVQRLLLTDLDATFESDPAANSKEEILFAYPGLFAIFVYRVAHELYLRQIPMIPRIMSEYAHSRTGIDIHPGAQIGAHFFIDHGTGIVVGETTVIGENVKLYQGVTLGALSPRKGHASLPGKRHPTVGSVGQLGRTWNVPMGAGSGIPVMNRRAAQFLLEQGCRFVTASSELSGAELRTLMQNHPPVVVPAYGREQLMLLHHCPARTYLGLTKGHAACRMCDQHSPDALAGQTLTDRRGTVYPLLRQRLPEGCLVRLMNALPTNNIRRVRQAGYAPMMVLTTENAQEAADVRAVMDGEMRELEGTSNHWNRPVE